MMLGGCEIMALIRMEWMDIELKAGILVEFEVHDTLHVRSYRLV